MCLSRKAGYLGMPQGQPVEDPVVPESSVNNEATSPAASTNVESLAEDQPMINTPVKKSNTSTSKGKGKAAKRNVSAHSKPLPICVKEGLDQDEIESDVEEDDIGNMCWDAVEKEEEDDDEDNEDLESDNIDEEFIKWQRDTPPVQAATNFTGIPGPQHRLSPEISVPFNYFLLYIPIYFWSRIAQYTNCKAWMTKEDKVGKIF